MCSSMSTPNPNSNWLDRLRSSKGFSISPDLQTLDQFLSSNPNPDPDPNPIHQNPPTKPPIDEHRHLFNPMSNVLSDLFVMGNPQNPSNRAKAARKQPNPRNCSVGAALSGNNSVVGEVKKRKLKVRKGLKDLEIAGFLRMEVTVIDTSLSPDWKGARVLYRKGLVWKVRERKAVRFGRKKRKLLKAKERNEGSAGGTARREQLPLLVKGCTGTDKRVESKETEDEILKLKRSKFSRSPRIPASKTSPILRLKVISKKNGAASAGECFGRKMMMH